jgi:small conductance mechanosensitive channel
MVTFDMETIYPIIYNLAKAVLIFVVGWLGSKWANRLTRKILAKRDPALVAFLGGLAQYTVLAATVIASLGEVGVQTTSLVAVLASAGLAIGLAFQGSLSNFASGIMILLFRPFTLEQRVTVAGHPGVVKDVGIFATTLVTPENETIIIPNSKITSDAIINHTVRGTLRAGVEVGVAYGVDVDKVVEVLKGAAARVELVLTDPEPKVVFTGLGASSLDFKILVWSASADSVAMQHAVRRAVYEDLGKAGIEIPFNQLVVHKA